MTGINKHLVLLWEESKKEKKSFEVLLQNQSVSLLIRFNLLRNKTKWTPFLSSSLQYYDTSLIIMCWCLYNNDIICLACFIWKLYPYPCLFFYFSVYSFCWSVSNSFNIKQFILPTAANPPLTQILFVGTWESR